MEGKKKKRREEKKERKKKKSDEEPMPVRFCLSNGKILRTRSEVAYAPRGRGSLILWLFLVEESFNGHEGGSPNSGLVQEQF